ncbi:MAG: hypothetical protein AAF583_06605 [Pseudomonadota bacterium]
MTAKFITNQTLWPHWREIERRAKPWQQVDRERRYNPETSIGGPPWTGATIAESSAPVYPTGGGVSDEEYARRAAEIRASKHGTRFYDGFHP